MGFHSEMMTQQHEQGWDFSDESVCAGCIDDPSLKIVLEEAADNEQSCDFCNSMPAAPLDVLLEAFVNGLRNEYEDAIESVPWEGREGGYQWWPQWDTFELLYDHEWVFENEALFETVRDTVHNTTWVEKDFVTRRRDEVLAESWNEFCDAIKFNTRFVFWLLPKVDPYALGAGEISPADILHAIGRIVDQLELVYELPAGYRIWRAQTHNKPKIKHSAKRLGTVPRDRAIAAHRMSPAGIPMFYGATDAETAVQEVIYQTNDDYVTWCQFELTTDLAVVDLTNLPPEPSMFDPKMGSMRRELRFLNSFAQEICDPVESKNEQIDYVPTQIITEYFLRIHGSETRPYGLLYKSSLANGNCVALDVPNDHCISPKAPETDSSTHLRLIKNSVECRKISRCVPDFGSS